MLAAVIRDLCAGRRRAIVGVRVVGPLGHIVGTPAGDVQLGPVRCVLLDQKSMRSANFTIRGARMPRMVSNAAPTAPFL
jgi:hypothetical protein